MQYSIGILIENGNMDNDMDFNVKRSFYSQFFGLKSAISPSDMVRRIVF